MENRLPFEKIEKTILIKKQSVFEKDSRPKRTVEELLDYGIINIDKPKGPTSHQVSDFVQKILKIKKAGHSGTLDPNVTGSLPICLGKATKAVEYLLKEGKEYVCIMHLHKDVDEAELRKVMESFIGEITQLPPLKSAVKREKRKRKIYYLNILEIDKKDVLFKVGCEAGTYIRKLCTDIGKKLNTGAHMAELRRTRVGPYNEDTIYTLQDLKDAFCYYKEESNDRALRKMIQPIETAIEHLPKIWVDENTITSLSHGAPLAVPGIIQFEDIIQKGDDVAVLSLNNELICIGKAVLSSIELNNADKGIAVKTDKVFVL